LKSRQTSKMSQSEALAMEQTMFVWWLLKEEIFVRMETSYMQEHANGRCINQGLPFLFGLV
jgi:hypothetical protein